MYNAYIYHMHHVISKRYAYQAMLYLSYGLSCCLGFDCQRALQLHRNSDVFPKVDNVPTEGIKKFVKIFLHFDPFHLYPPESGCFIEYLLNIKK